MKNGRDNQLCVTKIDQYLQQVPNNVVQNQVLLIHDSSGTLIVINNSMLSFVIANFFISDEAHFTLYSMVNKQNLFTIENLCKINERPLHSQKRLFGVRY